VYKFKKLALIASAQLPLSRAPAALAFMAGTCEKNQIDYAIWDLNAELARRCGQTVWDQCNQYTYHNLDTMNQDLYQVTQDFLLEVVQEIKSQDCDCVAVTVLSYVQNQWAERFLRLCRQVLPDVTLIMGGPGVGSPYAVRNAACSFGRWMVDQDLLDYYVLGEGDIALDLFLQGKRTVPGLNSKSTVENWQPQIENLDDMPRISYRKVDFDLYQGSRNQASITINGSRGCVRRCTFCDVGSIWKKFQYRSGESLAREIVQHWLDTGVKEYWFTDSLINGSLKQFNQLLEQLDQAHREHPGFQGLHYSGMFIIRPRSSHSERMYQLMARTGCTHIAVGVESGSERVRNHMGKKFSNDDIDYHMEMCERYGITNWMLTLVGYPTETEEDFQATLDMYTRLQRYAINNTLLGINTKTTMTILPNTPIEAMQHDLGVEFLHGDGFDLEWRAASNPDLTVRERYLRWIRLLRHAMDLGYNLSGEILIDTEINHRRAMSMVDTEQLTIAKSQYSIIPIVSAPSGVLS